MFEADPPPLGANPIVALMKAYEEEKLKKDKAITCLHSGLADHIFTKIMDLETPKLVWDKLQGEFDGSDNQNYQAPHIEERVWIDEDEKQRICERLF